MSIVELNWSWFILCCVVLGVTRILFIRLLPFRIFSLTTAATAGFIFFLAFPVLGYSSTLQISLREYNLNVWLAYLCFLGGAVCGRQVWGEHKERVNNLPRHNSGFTNFALVYCVIWVTILAIKFFSLGGVAHMLDVLFGGWAHLQRVAEIEDLVSSDRGLSGLDMGRIFLDNIFLCLWIVVFTRMPWRAVVLWAIYVLTNLDVYVARSTLLGLALIPLLGYLILNRISYRRLTLIACLVLAVSLMFFSWDSSVRLGHAYNLSADQVVSDTIRDAGNSAIPATTILSNNIRGNPYEYILAMATFMIPRSVWVDKPSIQYNYDMTYFLTGMVVGHGTSIITSTMLGEAWYYFGWSGVIWVMLMFGFFAYSFENLLTKDVTFLGLYLNLFYLTIIYLRSTFLAYYQAGMMAALVVISMMIIHRFATLGRKKPAVELVVGRADSSSTG